MKHAIRQFSARRRGFILYGMALSGELDTSGWTMSLGREALLAAVGAKPRERVGRVVLVVCEGGISVRSRRGRTEVRARGFWASPIEVEAWRLRRALTQETERQVHLEFANNRLSVNGRSLAAREI